MEHGGNYDQQATLSKCNNQQYNGYYPNNIGMAPNQKRNKDGLIIVISLFAVLLFILLILNVINAEVINTNSVENHSVGNKYYTDVENTNDTVSSLDEITKSINYDAPLLDETIDSTTEVAVEEHCTNYDAPSLNELVGATADSIQEAEYTYTIYEENGITYATANDIVYISKHDISSKSNYKLDGVVCVTGKVKNFNTTQSYLFETVYGNYQNYHIWFTDDTIYVDNDIMESTTGITVDIVSEIREDCLNEICMSIAYAEEYDIAKTDFYIFNDALYWIEEQERTGNLKEGVTVRVSGIGKWDLFDTYTIDCTKVEILNSEGEVISVYEYIEEQ